MPLPKAQTLHKPNNISTKNLILGILFFTFLILMLTYPNQTITGASKGLLLWFDTLLPTLLPFIMISGILIRLNFVPTLSKIIYPLLKPFLPISQNGAYPVFIGFLSGLPVGAKVSAELSEYGKISRKEAIFIASMCNNASPSFIINFVAAKSLKDPSKGLLLLVITYISSITASLLTYSLYLNRHKRTTDRNKLVINTQSLNDYIYNKESNNHDQLNENILKTEIISSKTSNSILNAIDTSIMSAFEAVAKVGGYIILFSILTELTGLLPLPITYTAILNGFLEITTGVKNLSLLSLNPDIKFILISAFTSFGGLSATAQTGSVMSPSGLSVKPYLTSKLIQGIIAAIISLFIITIM